MKRLAAFAFLLLPACTTLAERASNECRRAGYVDGTPEFAQCFQIVGTNLAIQRQNALQSLSNTGGGLMMMSVPQQRQQTMCFQQGMYFFCQ